jgi:hypothetical protein
MNNIVWSMWEEGLELAYALGQSTVAILDGVVRLVVGA